MITTEPDYKLLYEQSQKKLAETEQKLHLALLEVNQLRRKLFGLSSDNRVKKASQGPVDILPLGVTPEDVAVSEDLLKQEVKQVHEKQEAAAEKRKSNPRTTSRMVLPDHLEGEEVLLDPAGDLSGRRAVLTRS